MAYPTWHLPSAVNFYPKGHFDRRTPAAAENKFEIGPSGDAGERALENRPQPSPRRAGILAKGNRP
jgi:hypothetical protein